MEGLLRQPVLLETLDLVLRRSVDDNVMKGKGQSVFRIAASCHSTAPDKFVMESFLHLVRKT